MPSTSIHGTPDYAELAALGLRPEEVIYFSSEYQSLWAAALGGGCAAQVPQPRNIGPLSR